VKETIQTYFVADEKLNFMQRILLVPLFFKGKRSRNLLVCAGDDEICVVHCNKVNCKLTCEMVLVIIFSPVFIRIWILCFLQCVRNSTLHEIFSLKVI